jgi:hypothetical protein
MRFKPLSDLSLMSFQSACKRDDPWNGIPPSTLGGGAPAPYDAECDTGRFEDLPK